jgi:phosphoribosyl 1,2-cyclic phosphodiesterase
VRVSVLASGSSGNATLVEANGNCVLIDCGVSYRQLTLRMRRLGLEPARIGAVFLSHEHCDHVQGLEVFRARHRVPVLATAGTAEGLGRLPLDGVLASGKEERVGPLTIVPVATSHDAREPVGFVLEHCSTRVGLVTDTGVVTALLLERLAGCSALLLEANHDLDMLRIGSYPWPLKQRISSSSGHLANAQTRVAIEQLLHDRLEAVVAMHLSQENNTPLLVRREVESLLAGSRVRLEIADQSEPMQLELGGGPREPRQASLFEASEQ